MIHLVVWIVLVVLEKWISWHLNHIPNNRQPIQYVWIDFVVIYPNYQLFDKWVMTVMMVVMMKILMLWL